MTEPVHVVLTGGTIDSQYDGYYDTVVPREHSILPAYFDGLRLEHEVTFAEVCMKDSRTVNDEDRAEMVDAILASGADRIIVSHGLYTIDDTAKYLANRLAKHNKTVVLTGSLVPLDGMAMSDAAFNLGHAFAQVLNRPAGVYVCRSGVTKAVA